MASFNPPNQKMRSVGLDGLGAFLNGQLPKNSGLDREEIVRLFNRNMAHRGQVANRSADHQAALDAGKSGGSQQPLGRPDFGTGTPPNMALPESIPTEILLQFLETRQNKRPLPSPPDSEFNDQVPEPERFEMMQGAPRRQERFEMMQGAPRRPARTPESFAQLPVDENGVVTVLDSDDAIHYERMDGGDTNIAYTEPGEMVLPKAVGDRHPRVRQAIADAIRQEGGDERQYIAGNPEGKYDEVTGAQKFSWYDTIVDIGDYVANRPWAQSAVTGLTTAGIGKLSGMDTKSSLYTGLGAGLGSYAGRGIGNMLETTTETAARKAKPEYNTLADKDEGYEATLDDVKASLKQALSNTVGNRAANYGATAGLTLGQQMAPPPKNNYVAPNMPAPTIPSIVDNEYYDQFKPNQQANISATIPQPNPVAPMNMSYLPEGVTYQDKVRDRETGDYNYQKSSRQDQSAFARAIAGTTARRGRGFGDMILV